MRVPLVLRNALYLLSSNVFIRFLTAITTIFVARYLGPGKYGMLGVGFALSGVMAFFTDLGLNHTIIRESTKPDADRDGLFASLLKTKAVLTVITIAVGIGLIELLYPSQSLKIVVLLITIPTIFGTALDSIGSTYFVSTQQMKYVAVSKTVSGILSTAFLIVGLSFNWSVYVISAIYGSTSVVTALMSFGMAMPKVRLFRGWNRLILQDLGAFAMGGFVVMILPLLGPIILEKVTTLKQVGLFAGAYRIPTLLYQIPGVVATAFYPRLFEHGNRGDYEAHRRLTIQEIKLMSGAGILMAIPFVLYPQWIMNVVFGHQWGAAVSDTLALLSIVVVLQSINFPLSDALTTQGLQSRRTLILAIDLLIGISAYIFFGRMFGSFGGALAVLISESVLTVGLTLLNPVGITVLYKGLRFSIPAFVLALIIGFTTKAILSPPFVILGSMAMCGGMLWVFDRELRLGLTNMVAKQN